MQIKMYLIVNESGGVVARKNQPRPQLGEVVIPLQLQIPDTVFRPRIPQPIAIEVPETHIAQPTVETFEPEVSE